MEAEFRQDGAVGPLTPVVEPEGSMGHLGRGQSSSTHMSLLPSLSDGFLNLPAMISHKPAEYHRPFLPGASTAGLFTWLSTCTAHKASACADL